jgi:hypothetical protein
MTNAAMAGPVFAPQALQRCRSRRVSCLFTPLVAGGGGTRRARRCARQVPRSGGRRHQAAHGDDLSRMEVEGGLRRLLQRSKNCRPASAPGEGRLRLYLASLRQARGPKADPQITTVQINHEADSSFFRHQRLELCRDTGDIVPTEFHFMSESGQSRSSGEVHVTSAFPLTATKSRTSHRVSDGP